MDPVDTSFSALPGLRILDFDSEVVVFNPRSWDAHILNLAADMVLGLLARSPRTQREIEAALFDALSEEERTFASEHAKQVLNDLRSVGLIVEIGEDGLAGY